MGKIKNRSKLKNVEFIRFFFAVSIVYFHLLHSAMMPYTGEAEIYTYLAEQSKYAKYIVECFFIMSGYFLYGSLLRYPEQKTMDFLSKKIIRLWPVLAISTVFSMIFLDVPVSEGILNLFFLQSTGLTTGWKGLNWYVSAFFFAEVFYFLLYRTLKNSRTMKIVVCMLVYFGYVLNIVTTDGGFGRKVVYGVFSLAIARAIAGVGLGYLLGNFYDGIKEKYQKTLLEAGTERKAVLGISLAEMGSLLVLLGDFFGGKQAGKNQFIVVIFFSVFFVCMLTEKGIFSRLISKTPICVFGKYAYSIYVMQEAAFYLLKKTLWKNTGFMQTCPTGALGVSVLVAVCMGVAVYYLVEKPALRLGRYTCR